MKGVEMSRYVGYEYEEIEKELEHYIKEYQLDPVTVKSLIRGSIEFHESDLPKAEVVIIKDKDLSSSRRISYRNIQFNLKFALDSIFSFKSIFEASDSKLISCLLMAVLIFKDDIIKQLEEEETIVLYALYQIQNATENEIGKYIKKLKKDEVIDDINNINIKKALQNLEKIGCIQMKDGKYCLCEKIIIRKS